VDECGVRPVKPDGTRWSCTFSEDFDGAALDRDVWTPQRSRPAGADGVFACYTDRPENIAVAGGSLRRLRNHADGLCLLGFAVHVGGDWNVNALADDGEHDAWPEAALGDLLTSAWRTCGAGQSLATFGDGARMIDDWRTTGRVESVRALDAGASDHRLVVARIAAR
jgi:hypothetical protein